MDTRSEARTLKEMFGRVLGFINDTLCIEDVDDELYVAGSIKVELHFDRRPQSVDLYIEDPNPKHSFEEDLFERVSAPRPFNLTVLFGGLGAGKTTTVKYVVRQMEKRQTDFVNQFPCRWNPCERRPINIDFRDLSPKNVTDVNLVVAEVFRRMRLEVYKRIIEQWLNHNGNDRDRIGKVDHEYLVLRRLLMANDLRERGEHLELYDLSDSNLELDDSLISMTLSDNDLVKMIGLHKKSALNYEPKILKVVSDLALSRDLMSTILKFYQSTCHPENPMNLIVLDNLDQLPTPHIEEVLNELHDVATRATGFPLLTPFRPSSIRPAGFIRVDSYFRDHYGPSNFRMILNRLEQYVLNQSRESLRGAKIRNHKPFLSKPSENELDVLVFITYLYAKIMEKGEADLEKQKPKGEEKAEAVRIKLHDDHQYLLKGIRIGQGTLAGLAQTSDALVGVCCRYALDLMRRFFENAYDNPDFFQQAIRLRALHKSNYIVYLTYSELIGCLLRDPMSRPANGRVANLFEPTSIGRNQGWPTLVKLRILSLLVQRKRLTMGYIVKQLVAHGIPTELTIEALNTLQDKFKLLLWFSTNQPLSIKDNAAWAHEVVISEHGERYFSRIVGDFDYIWFCGTALHQRTYTYKGIKFSVKLNDYKVLIDRVGETEWKQIVFSRLLKSAKPDLGVVGHANQMEVLNVLYSSLGRALIGADIAMKVTDEKLGLVEELLPLVKEVCEQILFWQARYEVAYGSNFYLSLYTDQIRDLKYDITILQDTGFEGLELLSEYLNAVQESWLKAERSKPTLRLNDISHEHMVAFLEKQGSSNLPGLKLWVKDLDIGKTVNVFKERLVKQMTQLAYLLGERLLTYREIMLLLEAIIKDLNEVISRESDQVATGDGMLRWCAHEEVFLRNILQTFEDNAIDVPDTCNKEHMSELKVRANNIMDGIQSLANHLGAAPHLGQKWH